MHQEEEVGKETWEQFCSTESRSGKSGKSSEESGEGYGTNIVKPLLELGGGTASLDDLRATFVNILETPSLG